MEKTILHFENRIHVLTQRDPIGNAKIIKKLQRAIYNLQK